MRKLSLYSWRWAAAFAVAAMLAYVWLWYSPDLMAVKRWAATMSHHPVVVVTVMLTMAVTLAIGLPGSIGLWLIAPFYPPLIATLMLTVSSVAGAWGLICWRRESGSGGSPRG